MKKKLKLNINRARVSSDEIASKRNFETVLIQAKNLKIPFYKKSTFTIPLGLVIVASLILIWRYNNNYDVRLIAKSSVITSDNTEIYKETSRDSVSINKSNYKLAKPTSNGTKAKRLINKGVILDIPFDVYKINISENSTFIHKKGSIVDVPAHSLRTKAGKKAVDGIVEIHFREFKDAYDILISGITMKYDTAGTIQNLESAGMLEIRGFQNGEELEIIPEKSIKIKLISNKPDSNYNLYKIKDLTNKWEYKGKEISLVLNPKLADLEITDSTFDIKEVLTTKTFNTDIAPIKPVKKNPTKQNFKMVLGDKARKKWPYYDGMYFEVREESTKITSELYKILWKDVEIKPINDSTCMRVRFVGGKYKRVKTKSIKNNDIESVKNKQMDSKNMIIPSVYVNKSKYTNIFEDKSFEVDAYPVYDNKDSAFVMAQYYEQVASYKKIQEEAARLQRRADERAFRQFAGTKNLNKKQIETWDSIYRVFDVGSFGIWNADRIYKTGPTTQIAVKLVDNSGKAIVGDRLCLIYHEINSVFSYCPYKNGKYEAITVNPKSKVSFFIITEQGDIAYLDPEQYSQLNFYSMETIVKMDIRKNDFKSVAEMKKFMMGL